MKRCLLALFALCFTLSARAGGPEIELEAARIDEVVEIHGGRVVLRITGQAKFFSPKADHDDPWVRLPMDRATITVLGETLYAPSLEGASRWEKRLRAMVDTKQRLQLWGTTATVQGGKVSAITATVARPFSPIEGERRFDLSGLAGLEITESWKPAEAKIGYTRHPIAGILDRDLTEQLEQELTWLDERQRDRLAEVDGKEVACPAYGVLRLPDDGTHRVTVHLRATGNHQVLAFLPGKHGTLADRRYDGPGPHRLTIRVPADASRYLLLSCTNGHLFLDAVMVETLSE